MRAIWKGTISFGLVNIPIALGVATQRSDPSFRMLDRETLQPVKQQLYSPAREQTIARDETVKGFEVSKDHYVVLTDEELESVAVERRRTIDIVAFVDVGEIDPVYYDRTYYLAPQENAAKPYALLLEAMRETGKAGLGKIVLSSKEHLALLRPSGDALVIELLFYPEDVRPKTEIEELVRDTEVQRKELEMAAELVKSLAAPFEPDRFENEHRRDLMALFEKKLAGEEIAIVPEAPAPAQVPDLMSALKASIDQAKQRGGDGGSPAAAKPKAKKAAARGGSGSGKPAAKRKPAAGTAKPRAGAGTRARSKKG